MRNFESIILNLPQDEDLVADGWTRLARELGTLEPEQDLPEGVSATQLADFKAMEGARDRVAQVVQDAETAEALKPYYNVHCKRPTFHDEYLQMFNRSNVTLVDTGGKGVERITERGVVVAGKEYDVDCIIFSTGFEALAMTYRAGGFEICGVDGRSLEEKWRRNFKTLHGIFSHGFPNMMVLGQVRDGAGSFNATYPFEIQATHAAEVIRRSLERGYTRIEVTQEAEDSWRHAMREKALPLDDFLAECTPGYLNNEGRGGPDSLRAALYGGGTLEYEEILKSWLNTDGFEADLDVAPKASSEPEQARERLASLWPSV